MKHELDVLGMLQGCNGKPYNFLVTPPPACGSGEDGQGFGQELNVLGMLQVQREAIQAVEQDGIVFIDEIDKIVVNQDLRYGARPDATMPLCFVSRSQTLVHCKQSTALRALHALLTDIELSVNAGDVTLNACTSSLQINALLNTSCGLAFAGADASSEGVQRDLLPIIEGSQVSTKFGNVSTDHILFICSGAFHQCKPSDMLAELQGRLPIRVELKGLT